MASASACSVSKPNYHLFPYSHPAISSTLTQFQFPVIKFQNHFKNPPISRTSSTVKFNKNSFLKPSKLRAVSAEELLPEQESPPPSVAVDQTVSVAISPSDVLTMFFQAEGTMTDSAIPAVAKALEEVEGITDIKVHVLEGIASVELKKQTTVQATGVASNLVETIQGSGFKLQTLNLSFQDEEDFS